MIDNRRGEPLVRTLVATPGVASAYLFGSVAAGRAHAESDIDVGVVLDRSVYPDREDRFELRLRLIGRLQDEARRSVDLVIVNDAPPQFARHILLEGHRLMVANHEIDHAMRRLMLSRAADLDPFLRRTRARKLDALAR